MGVGAVMPLIYITGNSGAGKSSVRRELQRRGYEAHDTDDDDITAWVHKATGKLVEQPEDESDRTKGWYDQHEWKMSRQRVEEFAKHAKDKPVFLCGSPTNADDMLDLYDQVVCLVVDEETLQRRIASRTDHDFGKAPDELESILGWHDSFQERYREHGAVMIDATQPIEKVVDEILTYLGASRNIVLSNQGE
jgi:adenylate kinase family enzyme